jgi:hypothetical protein
MAITGTAVSISMAVIITGPVVVTPLVISIMPISAVMITVSGPVVAVIAAVTRRVIITVNWRISDIGIVITVVIPAVIMVIIRRTRTDPNRPAAVPATGLCGGGKGKTGDGRQARNHHFNHHQSPL